MSKRSPYKKPTTWKKYHSPIVPLAVADAVMEERRLSGTSEARWFADHVDCWVRWFHANDPKWRRRLDRADEKDLDWVYMWVNHWADSFIKDPQKYVDRWERYGGVECD